MSSTTFATLLGTAKAACRCWRIPRWTPDDARVVSVTHHDGHVEVNVAETARRCGLDCWLPPMA